MGSPRTLLGDLPRDADGIVDRLRRWGASGELQPSSALFPHETQNAEKKHRTAHAASTPPCPALPPLVADKVAHIRMPIARGSIARRKEVTATLTSEDICIADASAELARSAAPKSPLVSLPQACARNILEYVFYTSACNDLELSVFAPGSVRSCDFRLVLRAA